MTLTSRRSFLARCLGAVPLAGLAGCVVTNTIVRNPLPGMTKIGVLPFFNLSTEPPEVVDGRRFGLAYFSELQKIQGFEVIPVGVVETAILQRDIALSGPQDILTLCQEIEADAMVIGAVTDYDPYYPPRIGMQIDWYSPYQFEGLPTGIGQQPICPPEFQIRGQSPEQEGATPNPATTDRSSVNPIPLNPGAAEPVEPDFNQPLMSYTRVFDGADQEVVNNLRDYLELRGDVRGGGWEAFLNRSDDFIRFCCYQMVKEMLALHGGATRTQVVFKFRKYR